MYVESSPQTAAAKAAELFREIARDVVAERGVCHVSLAGGTTPRSMYQLLAAEATTDGVPWNCVEIYLGDERDVPQDDVDSNFRMVQRTLLDQTPIDWSRVHPMRADADDIDAAAREYEDTIRHLLPPDSDGVPQFDIMLLGMGGDGHTASLFPDSPVLDEQHKLITSIFVPVLGRKRMTMTFPLINAARNILMLITGDDKASAVRDVFGSDATRHDLPASMVKPKHGTQYVVFDQSAHRLLE